MDSGQTTYLHIGIDGSGAQSGARVVQRSLDDVAASATHTQSALTQMKAVLFGVAGATAGIYGLNTAIQALGNYAKESLNYLGLIETATLGIASSFLVSGSYIDRTTGKALEGTVALNAAQAESAKIIEQLKFANLQTIATLDELIVAYQTTLPVAMSRGFDKTMVMEFTKSMVQAAGAIGLPFNQMAEETRSLLLGTINPRNTRIATVLGLTNADINAHKGNAKELFDFLMQRLEGFRVAGEASQNTWKGLWSNFKDVTQQISGELFKPAFDSIKQSLSSFMKEAIIIDKDNQTYKLSQNIQAAVTAVKALMAVTWEAAKALTAYIVIYKGGALAETIFTWISAKKALLSSELQLQAAEQSGSAVRLGGVEQRRAMAMAAYDAAVAEERLAQMILGEAMAQGVQLEMNIASIASEQALAAVKLQTIAMENALAQATVRKTQAQLADNATKIAARQADIARLASMEVDLANLSLTAQEERELSIARKDAAIAQNSLAQLTARRTVLEQANNVAVNQATLAQERYDAALARSVVLSREKQGMNVLNRNAEVAISEAKLAHAAAQEKLNGTIAAGNGTLAAAGVAWKSLGFWMNAAMAAWIGWEIGTWLNKFETIAKAGTYMAYGLNFAFNYIVWSAKLAAADIQDIFTGGMAGAREKVQAQAEAWQRSWRADLDAQLNKDAGGDGTVKAIKRPDLEKQEYEARKREEHQKNEMKNAIDHHASMLALQKQYAENRYNLIKAQQEQELAIVTGNYNLGLANETTYLAKKRQVAETEALAAIQRARENLNDINSTMANLNANTKSATPEDETKLQKEMAKLTKDRVKAEGELAVAQVKYKTADIELTFKEMEAMKKVKDVYDDYAIARLEGEGKIMEAIDKKIEKERRSAEFLRLQLDAEAEKQAVPGSKNLFDGAGQALADKIAVQNNQLVAGMRQLQEEVIAYNDLITKGNEERLVGIGYTSDEVNLLMQEQKQQDMIYALELRISTELLPAKKALLELELDNLKEKIALENKYLDISKKILDLQRQQSGMSTALRVLEANGVAGLEEYKRILQEIVIEEKYLAAKKEMSIALDVARLGGNTDLIYGLEESLRLLEWDYNMRNSSLDAQRALNEALGITNAQQDKQVEKLKEQVIVLKRMSEAATMGEALNSSFSPGEISSIFSSSHTTRIGDITDLGAAAGSLSGMGFVGGQANWQHTGQNQVVNAAGQLQWVTKGMENTIVGYGMTIEEYRMQIEAQRQAMIDAQNAIIAFNNAVIAMDRDLLSRVLVVAGDGDASARLAMQIKQEDELAKARKDGMDVQKLIMVQELEWKKMMAEQAVGIAQKAYDAAKALMETAKTALQKTISDFTSKVQSTLTASNNAYNSITTLIKTLKGGDLSTLTPQQKYEQAKSEYLTVANRALQGDSAALEQIATVAEKFLQASRGYNASGSGYVSDYNAVQSDLALAAEIALAQKTIAEQQLAALTTMVNILNGSDTTSVLNEQFLKLTALDTASGTLNQAINGTTSAVSGNGGLTGAVAGVTAAVGGTTLAVGGTNEAVGAVNTNLGNTGVIGSVTNLTAAINGDSGSTLTAVQAVTAALGTTTGATNTVAGAIGTNLTSASGIGQTMAEYKNSWDATVAAGGVLGLAKAYSANISEYARQMSIYTNWKISAADIKTALAGSGGIKVKSTRWSDYPVSASYYHDQTVAYYAKGGKYPGGSAVMGEEGPEFVDSSPGYVYRADETKALFTMAKRGASDGYGEDVVRELVLSNKHQAAQVRTLQAGFNKLIASNEKQSESLQGLETKSKLQAAK